MSDRWEAKWTSASPFLRPRSATRDKVEAAAPPAALSGAPGPTQVVFYSRPVAGSTGFSLARAECPCCRVDSLRSCCSEHCWAGGLDAGCGPAECVALSALDERWGWSSRSLSAQRNSSVSCSWMPAAITNTSGECGCTLRAACATRCAPEKFRCSRVAYFHGEVDGSSPSRAAFKATSRQPRRPAHRRGRAAEPAIQLPSETTAVNT
jgi:hypothetical protein